MADIQEAFRAISAAYNDGEPVGSRVAVRVHAVWHRWCVSCRKKLTARARWRIVNDHVFCHACDVRLANEQPASVEGLKHG
jgi:hypothetical protein